VGFVVMASLMVIPLRMFDADPCYHVIGIFFIQVGGGKLSSWLKLTLVMAFEMDLGP